MNAKLDAAVKELTQVLLESGKNKTSPYDTQAEVKRVEGNIAWVHIPGGVDETPVRLTMNAQAGDIVQVRVSGGNAWLAGNATSPPTDDTQANVARRVATQAIDKASDAIDSATTAQIAAERAVSDAETARIAALQASEDAERAETAANTAQTSADNASQSAVIANQNAQSAIASATTAIDQLSIVENVVGVLDLLSKHGTYTQITDTDAVAENGKWYFTRSGSGTTADPYTYSVANVIVDESVTGYYELTDIDQAITNYVSSHLALTDDGLSLQQDGSDYRILISTNGLKIIGANGATVASYGTDTIIGNQTGFHVKIDGTELGFYQGTQRVAYINNNQLYITQSVVLQQMDLGMPVGFVNPVTGEVGKGQWSWKVHPNRETPSRNNLNLKWIG